jgi:hypothetical protein
MYNKKSSCCQPPPAGQRNSSCYTQLSIPLNDDPYLNHGIRFQTAEGFTIALKLMRQDRKIHKSPVLNSFGALSPICISENASHAYQNCTGKLVQ